MTDHYNRREQRNSRCNQVFNTIGDGVHQPNASNLSSAKSTFQALERAVKKETSKWWEAASLKKYVEHYLIPRGLRILIFPPIETTSQERLKQWEASLQTASNNMLHQLIDIAQEEFEKYLDELDTLNRLIEEANWGDITKKNYDILNRIIDEYVEDIIRRKNRKFCQHLTDYQLGRVYTFSKKYDNIKTSSTSIEPPSGSASLQSSDLESLEETGTCHSLRPEVHFCKEVRRHRLGTA
ncbi:hypothetical protein NDU88_004830 [Pleurodeles waltl]|uniref:Uncharacterized protein n=1 Tax=Pleurodeles waltl TaxID=8319 RepID=A0AAV7W6C4_PLEWA|nr:hypothetical protein NDU88_004830 [Pleurodeles waltl]